MVPICSGTTVANILQTPDAAFSTTKLFAPVGILLQSTIKSLGGDINDGIGVGFTVTFCVCMIVRPHPSVNVQLYAIVPPHMSGTVPDGMGVAEPDIKHAPAPLLV
jgi:hypothetical protein